MPGQDNSGQKNTKRRKSRIDPQWLRHNDWIMVSPDGKGMSINMRIYNVDGPCVKHEARSPVVYVIMIPHCQTGMQHRLGGLRRMQVTQVNWCSPLLTFLIVLLLNSYICIALLFKIGQYHFHTPNLFPSSRVTCIVANSCSVLILNKLVQSLCNVWD